jgi:hypothetical protein
MTKSENLRDDGKYLPDTQRLETHWQALASGKALKHISLELPSHEGSETVCNMFIRSRTNVLGGQQQM